MLYKSGPTYRFVRINSRDYHEAPRVSQEARGGKDQVRDHKVQAAEVVASNEDKCGRGNSAHNNNRVHERLSNGFAGRNRT
jgi:hypothetical protein